MGDIRVDLKGLEEFQDKIQKAADEAGRQAFMVPVPRSWRRDC